MLVLKNYLHIITKIMNILIEIRIIITILQMNGTKEFQITKKQKITIIIYHIYIKKKNNIQFFVLKFLEEYLMEL